MQSNVNQIKHCEVCGNRALQPALDLGRQPLCDDLIPVGSSKQCEEYPIQIEICPDCITAHQKYQVEKRDLFPDSYHYRSRFTADVLDGMRQLVNSCISRHGPLSGKLVLDVGCNDGSLLSFFRDAGAKTVGIEPTGACVDAEEQGHPTYNAFLDMETAARVREEQGTPDFITFTNVFAHIEDLAGVVRSLNEIIDDDTVLVIENHYLGGIISRNQFDSFYHEHPRTYSCTSFLHIARMLKMNVVDVEFPSRYGGNIRVSLKRNADEFSTSKVEQVLEQEKCFPKQLEALQSEIKAWVANKRMELKNLVTRFGPLPAKAFPGRAAILVKLLQLDTDIISKVYEKPGSKKIGHYLPGSRIPIVSDEEFHGLKEPPPVLVNFAWHISREIRNYLVEGGFEGQVVDILDQQDFQKAA